MNYLNKEERLLTLMEDTGYDIIQENGQRVFGPPPTWPPARPKPGKGCEVFVGRLPRDCFEDELVPVMRKVGPIYQLRLMMHFSGSNRGFAFVTYTNPTDAEKAIKGLDNYEIRPNKRIGVVKSVDNCRLFIGNIPAHKTREDVMAEVGKVTDNVINAIVYNSDKTKTFNNGFAFVEYSSHRDAAMARRKLLPGKYFLFGSQISVDWAIAEPVLDETIMTKVTGLFVRYLNSDATEHDIEQFFSLWGRFQVLKVKRIKNYAFVHYYNRSDAEKAFKDISAIDLSATGLSERGQKLDVMWAKPPNAISQTHKLRKSNHNSVNCNDINSNQINFNFGDSPLINNFETYSLFAGLNPLAASFQPKRY